MKEIEQFEKEDLCQESKEIVYVRKNGKLIEVKEPE